MKRSELKLTGETYKLSPDAWGEQFIVTDEGLAISAIRECFGMDENEELATDYAGEVEIAVDDDGQHYAILIPYEGKSWGKKTGVMHNENMYKLCANPGERSDGMLEISTGKWQIFDDEE